MIATREISLVHDFAQQRWESLSLEGNILKEPRESAPLARDDGLLSHARIVCRRSVDRRHFRAHRAKITGELSAMMHGVEQESEQHVAQRGLPHHLAVHFQASRAVPL